MNTEDLYRLLRTGHIQAQGIVDTITDPLLVLDAGLCVQNANRAFFDTFHVDRYETIGQPIYALGNGQWDIPELRRLLMEVIPRAAAVINYEVEHDFPGLGQRTMLLTARMLYHPDGGSHSLLLTIVDATERHRKDAESQLLFGELRHRMNNFLAVAQAIAHQTTTQGRSAEEYRDVFLGRFAAMVEAQNLAFKEQPKSDLATLVERILAPFTATPEGVVIEEGASVKLSARMLLSLGLIMHELATNALKYGALSRSGGQVRVSWRVDPENGRLSLKWSEAGGPPARPPTRTGYGTELIQSTASYTLGGHVEQNYAAAGLQAEIVIPLGSVSPPD